LPAEAEQLVHSLISREEALSMAKEIAGPWLEEFMSVESASRRVVGQAKAKAKRCGKTTAC